MSATSKIPRNVFVQNDAFAASTVEHSTAPREHGPETNGKSSGSDKTSSILLRDDHIVLLAIDGLLALIAGLKKWRNRRRTVRALADLDERQLRDIGLTRDQIASRTFLSDQDHGEAK